MSKEGFTLWFTGWSGAGKTTIAMAIEEELKKRKMGYVQRLDGDLVREYLCHDLGFSKEDRNENIRRATFVAEMLSKNGVITLVSFISPYRSLREYARIRCHNFTEIYVKCDRDILIERDVKGLYKKALANEISEFTGISDPYEEPLNPELVLDTGKEEVSESVNKVIKYLYEEQLI
ncbi:adenylyl-sulfate kinase [Methanolobus sp.]|jgi:adenylylsulfate kinase|uniref:adenylyl-sulfate kinase n=1 Tax=Methanolobus sp. TaxID=1874737 RepID=UPI0025E73A2C|nr:adenylyl-sulfate kinase [Methanolobus sp.]